MLRTVEATVKRDQVEALALQGLTNQEIASRVRASWAYISRVRNRIGCPDPGRKRWSAAEVRLLDRLTPKQVAARTGRSLGSVRRRLQWMAEKREQARSANP